MTKNYIMSVIGSNASYYYPEEEKLVVGKFDKNFKVIFNVKDQSKVFREVLNMPSEEYDKLENYFFW